MSNSAALIVVVLANANAISKLDFSFFHSVISIFELLFYSLNGIQLDAALYELSTRKRETSSRKIALFFPERVNGKMGNRRGNQSRNMILFNQPNDVNEMNIFWDQQ